MDKLTTAVLLVGSMLACAEVSASNVSQMNQYMKGLNGLSLTDPEGVEFSEKLWSTSADSNSKTYTFKNSSSMINVVRLESSNKEFQLISQRYYPAGHVAQNKNYFTFAAVREGQLSSLSTCATKSGNGLNTVWTLNRADFSELKDAGEVNCILATPRFCKSILRTAKAKDYDELNKKLADCKAIGTEGIPLEIFNEEIKPALNSMQGQFAKFFPGWREKTGMLGNAELKSGIQTQPGGIAEMLELSNLCRTLEAPASPPRSTQRPERTVR